MKKLNGEEERKLQAVSLRRIKPTDKTQTLADGHGLYLFVLKSGGTYWRYRYRFAGKQKELALGVYPDITLSEARKQHRLAYNLVADGIDPSEERREQKQEAIRNEGNQFANIVREWLDVSMSDKTDHHKRRAERLLLEDLSGLANRLIDAIKAPELLAELRKIEKRGHIDTARRTRQLAAQLFTYAIATGRAERNIANDLAGTLKNTRTKNRAAITDPILLGKLLNDMEHSTSGIIVRTAMLLTPMLFQRPGEIRAMEWSEIDFSERRWEIPAEKMKMSLPHIVPLPEQAIKLLKEIQPHTGRGKYVFPSARGASRCLSENGVRTALRDLGYSNEVVTPHGFRATARTLLDEVLRYRVELIEHQLAHSVKDANGRAYNRTTFIDDRAEMMQAWADYLDKLRRGAQVLSSPETV
tara:strand:+ start:223 stop:1464 length:1242 start_codon:yes stop_codon:yes gene_type:complete